MDTITTKSQMRDYIKLTLGAPVVQIELSDLNIDQIMVDSVQDFQRYNYQDGSYLDYIMLTTSAGVSEYSTTGILDAQGNTVEFESIYSADFSFGLDGINTLFTPTHMILYDQFVNKGFYPGGFGNGVGDNQFILTNYQVAMDYIKEVENMFGKKYRAQYIGGRKIIKIFPTPTDAMLGSIAVYRHEYAWDLYNHPLVKKLCVARALKMWGRNLNKYGGSLPDGISVNGQSIFQEGLEMEKDIMERIIGESGVLGVYIG